MPNRWPISSGNWSNSAIWSGSLIPTASDDVFLNNQTVTLDQTIIVRSINNTATGSAIAGGQLNIFADYNITATPNGISSNGATVTGGFIKYYNTGSISIIATFLQTRNTLENVNSGTINITGEVRLPGTGITNGRTITNSSNGIINIIGNITCPANPQSGNYAILNLLNGIINITGDVIGGSTASSPIAIVNASVGTINVTGNISGGIGNASTGHGINNSSIGTINITGTVTGGTSTSVGINSTTAGIINVIGTLQASTLNNAVSSTSTTATNLFSGPFINSGSRNAIYCYNIQMYKNAATSYQIGVSGSTDTITLLSEDQALGMPTSANVRTGTIYGPTSALTGSMAVPNPQSVSWGVAVDNTTGSALVKPEDLWNYAITSLTASNSIGQRLANASTSASNAAITNAFG